MRDVDEIKEWGKTYEATRWSLKNWCVRVTVFRWTLIGLWTPEQRAVTIFHLADNSETSSLPMFGQLAWSIRRWGSTLALELHMLDLGNICLNRTSCLPDNSVEVVKPGSSPLEVQGKLSSPPPVHSLRLAETDLTKCVSTQSVFLLPARAPNLIIGAQCCLL